MCITLCSWQLAIEKRCSMWACPDDLLKLFSELPQPALLLSSDKDLNVSDLAYIPREQALNQQIKEAVDKWNNVWE